MDSRLSSSIELFLSIVQFTSGNNANESWFSSISIAQNSDRLLCCDWLTLNLSHEYFSSLKTIHRSKLSFSEHSKNLHETRDPRTKTNWSRTKRFGPVLGPNRARTGKYGEIPDRLGPGPKFRKSRAGWSPGLTVHRSLVQTGHLRSLTWFRRLDLMPWN